MDTLSQRNPGIRHGRLCQAAHGLRDAAVQAYVLAKADEAEAKARKDGAAEDIKTELKARNASQLIVGNHKVELTPVAGRRSYDWKQMEKAGIDLRPFMTTGKPSERLTVE